MSGAIKLGMIGGGPGSGIGATHRLASNLDRRFMLAAGVFSRDIPTSRQFASGLGIDADRAYGSPAEMADSEASRPNGIEAVSIVTPNDSHAELSIAFLERGVHVICDKPIGTSSDQGMAVLQAQRAAGRQFVLTHNYSAYPMVREARARVQAGELGRIRLVQVEHAIGSRRRLIEAEGSDRLGWRTDPGRIGASAVLADLGTHAHHLARYISGI